jgi:DNA-binding CsgD family transcriptional regulator
VNPSDTSSSIDVGQQGFNRSLLSPFFLRSIILLSLYWAWMFLFHWTDALVISVPDGRESVLLMKLSGLGGASLALLAVLIVHWQRPGTGVLANSRILPLLTMPAAPVAALIAIFGLPISGAALYACWFVSGVGSVFVLIRIGQILPKFNTEAATTLIFISLFLAALLDCVLLVSPALAEVLTMLVIPFISIAVFWRVGSILGGNRQDAVGSAAQANSPHTVDFARPAVSTPQANLTRSVRVSQSDASIQPAHVPQPVLSGLLRAILNGSHLQMFAYSMLFGISQCVGVILKPAGGGAGSYLWSAFLLAGLAIMAYTMWLNRYARLLSFQMIILAFSFCALMPLMQLEATSTLRYILCMLICFGFTTYDLIELWRLSRTAALKNITSLRFFAAGRLANALGIFCGVAIAGLAHRIADTTAQTAMLSFVTVLLIIVLCVTALLMARWQDASVLGDDIALEYEVAADSDEGGDSAISIKSKRAWQAACDEVAGASGLSPREAEVFRLMVRGRDANYICEVLFVSHHTIKSHIYHIYQKIDIHSQQQLITMVEERARQIYDSRRGAD